MSNEDDLKGVATAAARIREALDAGHELARALDKLHALGWRLVTGGGDTVDSLAIVHVKSGASFPLPLCRTKPRES